MKSVRNYHQHKVLDGTDVPTELDFSPLLTVGSVLVSVEEWPYFQKYSLNECYYRALFNSKGFAVSKSNVYDFI